MSIKENILNYTPRIERFAFLIVFLGVAFFYLQLTSPNWIITPDSTDYVEGARSLAQLKGYINAQGQPLTFYPPGTSFVYAPAALIQQEGYYFFNLLTKLLLIGYYLFSALIIQRKFNAWAGLMAFLFLSFSIITFYESIQILSDVVFAFVFLLTLYLFPPRRLEHMTLRSAMGLGCLVALCFLVRTPGVFVFVGYFLYIICCIPKNKIRNLCWISAIFLAVFLLMALRSAAIGNEYSYLKLMLAKQFWVLDSGTINMSDWIDRIISNSKAYVTFLAVFFSNQYRPTLSGSHQIILLGGLTAWGMLRGFWDKEARLYIFMLISYIPIIILGQGRGQLRYIIPILPLALLFATDGFMSLLHRVESKIIRSFVVVVFAALLIISPYWQRGYSSWKGLNKTLHKERKADILYLGHEKFQDLVLKYGVNLSNKDVIATMHANIVRYFVPQGTKVVNCSLTVDVDKSYQAMRGQNVTYLYIDKRVPTIWPYVEPVIAKYSRDFSLIEGDQDVAFYRTAWSSIDQKGM